MANETDIARLGLEVDSTPVDKANQSLSGFVQISGQAEGATYRLTSATVAYTTAVSNGYSQARQQADAMWAAVTSGATGAAQAADRYATSASASMYKARDAALKNTSATAQMAEAIKDITERDRLHAASMASTTAAAVENAAAHATVSTVLKDVARAAETNAAAVNRGKVALDVITRAGHNARTEFMGLSVATSTATRELLVLIREAMRGDFTRMAGSATIMANALGLLTAIGPVGILTFIGLAGATALLTAAMIGGEKEASNFANALTATGNYAGMTASSFEDMAARISKSQDVSIGSVKGGIQQLVSSGKFTADTIELMVSSAERYSQLTGQSVEKILEDYSNMSGGITKWAVKHEETYHDLTLAQIDYINKLEQQGRHEEAEAELMNDIHNKVMTRAVPAYGILQQALHDTMNWASKMWDALMGIGRPKTLEEQIQAATNDVSALMNAPLSASGRAGGMNVQKGREEALAAARARLHNLVEELNKEQSDAAAAAKKAQDEDDAIRKKYDNQYKKPKAFHVDAYQTEVDQLNATANANRVLADSYDLSTAAGFRAAAMKKGDVEAARLHVDGLKLETLEQLNVTAAVTEGIATGYKSLDALKDKTTAVTETTKAIRDNGGNQQIANQAVQDSIVLARLEALAANAKGEDLIRAQQLLKDTREAQHAYNDAVRDQWVAEQMITLGKENDQLHEKMNLIGLTTREIDEQIAAQTALNELIAHGANPNALTQSDKGYINSKVQNAAGASDVKDAQDSYNKSLSYTVDLLKLVAENSQITGQGLESAFGNIGAVIGGINTAMANFAVQQQEIADDQQRQSQPLLAIMHDQHASVLARMKAESDLATVTQTADAKTQMSKEQLTNATISGIKSMFSQSSTVYKALTGFEMAYRAVQLAGTAKKIASDVGETASHVLHSGIRSAASGVEAVAKALASLPFPFNLAAGAVTAAAVASLGIAIAGSFGGSAPTVDPATMQKQTGTGTVLGDDKAQSTSISKALDLANKNENTLLGYNASMMKSLHNIEDNIGTVATAIAKSLSLPGGSFSTDGLGLGTSSGRGTGIGAALGAAVGGPLGAIAGAIMGFLFSHSTTNTLVDKGLNIGPQSVGSVVNNGVAGSTYQTVQSVGKTKVLGFTLATHTSIDDVNQSLPADLANSIKNVISSVRDTLVHAAGKLGLEGAEATIDAFQVDLGKFSVQGLSNDQISTQLEAWFSATADGMANTIIPGLRDFAKAGEGAFDTLSRLITEYTTVDEGLALLGMVIKQTGIEGVTTRDALIGLFGSMDDFTASTNYFSQHFLSKAEQMAPVSAHIDDVFNQLHVAVPKTRDEYKALVQVQDLATISGRNTFYALMALSPAFDQFQDYLDSLKDTTTETTRDLTAQTTAWTTWQSRQRLNITLLQTQGNAEAALRAQRELELATIDPTLVALQTAVYLAQDIATAQTAVDNARSVVTQAYNQQIDAVQQTIDKFQQFTDTLKEFRESLNTGPAAMLSPEDQYTATRSKFQSTYSAAMNGDEAAIKSLPGDAQAFLDASKLYNASSEQYFRDLASVKDGTDAVSRFTQTQVDQGTQQISILTQLRDILGSPTAGIPSIPIALNNLGIALNNLHTAQTAGGGGSLMDPQWGAYQNATVNQQLATLGYGGKFGAGGFDEWIKTQGETTKQAARDMLNVAGHAERIDFANGGVFTNGVVSQPTRFAIGRMGEGGRPEAAVPLVRTPTGLGVQVTRGGESDDETKALLRQVLVELRHANAQRSDVGVQTLEKLADVADKVDGVKREQMKR